MAPAIIPCCGSPVRTSGSSPITDLPSPTVTATTDKPVAVSAVNDPPVGVTDTFTTDEDTVKTGDVRSNDVDPDHLTGQLVVDQVNGLAGNVGSTVTLASGAKVSNPLARAHWPTATCRSRAETSLPMV